MKPDLNTLLLPLPGENPAGVNVEYEIEYEEIRQARESYPEYLPEDEWHTSLRKADWPKVVRLSAQILRETSKDLQVACWLVEGFSQQYGIAGARESLCFLHDFILRYWENGWPEKKDHDCCLFSHAILSRLDRQLAALMIRLPLLGQPESSLEYWRKVQAYDYQAAFSDEETETGDEGLSGEAYRQWASRQSAEKLTRLNEDLSHISDSLSRFELAYKTLNPGMVSPVLGQTAGEIDNLNTLVFRLNDMVKRTSDDVMQQNVLLPEDDQQLPQASALTAGLQSQNMSRDLAIAQMLTIAHFFRQTEPSSPVPFLMERAARWAGMTLTEWLAEMVSDNGSLNEINNVLTGPQPE